MDWVFKNKDSVEVQITKYPSSAPYGFVYELEYDDGTKYIGKKSMITQSILPIKKNGIRRPNSTLINKRIKMTKEDLVNRSTRQIKDNVTTKIVQYEVVTKETNWKKYEGSSKREHNKQVVSKTILEFAKSKRHLTYLEVKHLFINNTLEDENYDNDNILGKFFKAHLV